MRNYKDLTTKELIDLVSESERRGMSKGETWKTFLIEKEIENDGTLTKGIIEDELRNRGCVQKWIVDSSNDDTTIVLKSNGKSTRYALTVSDNVAKEYASFIKELPSREINDFILEHGMKMIKDDEVHVMIDVNHKFQNDACAAFEETFIENGKNMFNEFMNEVNAMN